MKWMQLPNKLETTEKLYSSIAPIISTWRENNSVPVVGCSVRSVSAAQGDGIVSWQKFAALLRNFVLGKNHCFDQRKSKLNTIITWPKVKVENCEKITKSLLDVLYFRLLSVFFFFGLFLHFILFSSFAKKNLENLILTSFVEIYVCTRVCTFTLFEI